METAEDLFQWRVLVLPMLSLCVLLAVGCAFLRRFCVYYLCYKTENACVYFDKKLQHDLLIMWVTEFGFVLFTNWFITFASFNRFQSCLKMLYCLQLIRSGHVMSLRVRN
jgi:hypothetical protein